MSLKPEPIGPVPEETARIARAAFPKGNLYLRLRDELGTLYQDDLFADLFPSRGQPAEAPWRLALVTIMQFLEGLSDRQAAEAVRSRLGWKYLLGLEPTDAGFHYSLLCEFQSRLLAGEAEHRLWRACCSRTLKLVAGSSSVSAKELTRLISSLLFAVSIVSNSSGVRSSML